MFADFSRRETASCNCRCNGGVREARDQMAKSSTKTDRPMLRGMESPMSSIMIPNSGTPFSWMNQWEKWQPMRARNLLSLKKIYRKIPMRPYIPFFTSFMRIPWRHDVSYAFSMSKKTAPEWRFLRKATLTSVSRDKMWSVVLLFFRKPHWYFARRSCFSRNHMRRTLTIFSNSLQRADVKDIGR